MSECYDVIIDVTTSVRAGWPQVMMSFGGWVLLDISARKTYLMN